MTRNVRPVFTAGAFQEGETVPSRGSEWNRRDVRAVPVDDKMTVAIKKVGVIGSGQMGNGIAHVAALAGFDVVLNDVSADRLKSAMATINGNLSRQVAKKIITEDARKQALDRISFDRDHRRAMRTAIW